MPFFLGEFVNADGSPYPVCPRQTLKRVLKRAKAHFDVMAGMEFRGFNFAETPATWGGQTKASARPLTPGMFGYAAALADNREFFNALMDEMAVSRADRRPAHRDRPRRLRGGDRLQRSAGAGRPRDLCSRPAPRRSASAFDHADFMAKWARKSTPVAQVTSTRACRSARAISLDAKSKRSMSKLFESYLAGQWPA